MTDIVSPQKRSQMMAGIPGKNTKPEILIRKLLYRLGFRFRIHNDKLPGKPDIVLKKYQAVIFVNGCFWHCHECHLFKWPKTRPDFWKKKICGNVKNDIKNRRTLTTSGWRICTIWECSLKGKKRKKPEEIASSTSDWLKSDSPFLEISG